MVSDPKIVQYVEELDLLIIRDGEKLYHIDGNVIAGMFKAYMEGHGIDYDICEGCECVDPETVVPLEDYRSMEQTVYKLTQSLAEAEPIKHGQWLKTGQSLVYPDKFRNYFCSVCGFELDTHIRQEPNYCPNCGARMDGGEE